METTENLDIYFFFFGASVLILLLAVSIIAFMAIYRKRIFNQQLAMEKKESEHRLGLIKNVITTTETERKRIAGDLHDEIGSHLSTIRMMLNRIQSGENDQSIEIASESKSLLDSTIASVRTISHSLLPPTLDKFGLINTVDDHCTKLRNTGLQVIFEHTGDFSALSKEKELALFRIIQELTTNTLRHAQATEIKIDFINSNGFLELNYSDNGVGFDESVLTDKKGMGLMNIESRAIAIGASAGFYSPQHKGFQAIIKMPQ